MKSIKSLVYKVHCRPHFLRCAHRIFQSQFIMPYLPERKYVYVFLLSIFISPRLVACILLLVLFYYFHYYFDYYHIFYVIFIFNVMASKSLYHFTARFSFSEIFFLRIYFLFFEDQKIVEDD